MDAHAIPVRDKDRFTDDSNTPSNRYESVANEDSESADKTVERQIALHMKGSRMQEAKALAETGLLTAAGSRYLHYTKAVCERYLGAPKEALKTLDTLRTLEPDYPRLYQEQGYCLRDLGDVAGARHAFEAAVARNPALTSSWRALGRIYAKTGFNEDLLRVKANLQWLCNLPAPLLQVADLLNDGELRRAEVICRNFLIEHPANIDGMRLLALIGARMNVLDDAEVLLKTCVRMDPTHHASRYDLVNVLSRRQKYQASFDHAQQLRASDPGNRRLEVLFANQCVTAGRYGEALDIYDRILAQLPDDPLIQLARGNVLKTLGRSSEAVHAYVDASRFPGSGEAFWSLSNLKTYRFSFEQLTRMQKLEMDRLTPISEKIFLCFAIGKALEDDKRHTDALDYYFRGNAMKAASCAYYPDLMDRDLRLQREICTPQLIDRKRGGGCPARDPIFIVGLPRSGSTLLEQILASHSQVDGTHELPNILSTAFDLDRRRRIDEDPAYPKSLTELTADDLRQLGESYIENTRMFRAGKPYFIDKMPNNFRHIGLIKLMLPNARIIDARRKPLSCCLSCFKQLFMEGQEFTYDLVWLGRYYSRYLEVMEHWNSVFPGEILLVRHEDVVDDLEKSVRRVLEFCGLPFEQACLEFYVNQRAVRTASAEQVRRPIYRNETDSGHLNDVRLEPLRNSLSEQALQLRNLN